MSKRLKPASLHTSLRLAPDVSANLATAVKLTGWSTARLVGHLVKLGFAASSGNGRTVDELRAVYLGAMKLHAVELENARRLAAARAEVRSPFSGSGSRPGATRAAKAARRPAVPPLPAAKPGSAA